MGRDQEEKVDVNIPEEKYLIRGMFFSGTGTTEKIVRATAAGMTEYLQGRPQIVFVPDMETEDPPLTCNAEDLCKGRTGIVFEEAETIDFTPLKARDRIYSFGPSDIVVFGVPVIAGRVPNVLLPFLNTLEGGGAMAVPVVLYGNRNFDDALIELRNILEERGFHTVAAGAFIGEHSFSRILAAGRPDEKDMQIAGWFAESAGWKIFELLQWAAERAAEKAAGRTPFPRKIARIGDGSIESARESTGREKRMFPDGTVYPPFAKVTNWHADCGAAAKELEAVLQENCPVYVDGEDPIRPYYKPRDRKGNHINILKVKPKLHEDKCTKCGICVAACPMGSIKAEAPGVVDGICIKCCGCEKKCPEGALYFDDPGYLYHKEELELGYPDRKEPKVFL